MFDLRVISDSDIARTKKGQTTNVCLIVHTINLNGPNRNELGDPLQPQNFSKNVSLVIDMAFVSPCILDHIVLLLVADMPARGSLAID